MTCLDENFFAAYFTLRLSPADVDRLFVHVDTCADCARMFSAMAAAHAHLQPSTLPDAAGKTAPHDGEPREPRRPTRLGRYEVESILGMGGMGVVYAAHDPELDRRVAIKLLRPDSRSATSSLRARLGREAQAMARLSHPNVINVHEIGTHGEQLFVVMELIDGSTLAEWLRERARSWREIVAVFVAAGAGLQAAHEAGVVHRDFKPDNVLISRDGRVCVTDFGLARIGGGDEPTTDRAPGASPVSPLGPTMTYAGLLVGTPAYMAPEQMRGEPTDARSDVFSFCVALYEALYGARPYRGQTFDELRAATEAGALLPPLRDVGPREYRIAVERGLRAKPAERPATMEELLAVLRQDPIARRRRRLLAAAAAIVAVTVAVGFYQLRQRTRACLGAERWLAGSWDDARKAQIHRAFAATGLPYAETMWHTVESTLDKFAGDWVAMSTEACEATRLRRTQSEALLDRRMTCLDARLDELRAASDLFATADRNVVDKGAQLAGTVGGIERCADLAELEYEGDGPTAAQRALAKSVKQRLAQLDALAQLDRFDEIAKLTPGVLADARRDGYRKDEAEAEHWQGCLAYFQGRFKDAETALHRAVVAGERAHYDYVIVKSWVMLAQIESLRGDIDQVLLWSSYAGGACDRLKECGDWQPLISGMRALALMRAGDCAAAVAEARRLLQLASQRPATDVETFIGRDNAATVLGYCGHRPEAEDILRKLVTQSEQTFGKLHTNTINAMLNLGGMLLLDGKFAEALPIATDAYQQAHDQPGANPELAAVAFSNVAESEEGLGRLPVALQHMNDVLALYRQVDLRGGNLVEMLTHKGRVERALGKPGAAATLERAVAEAEAAHLGGTFLAEPRFALAQALPSQAERRALALASDARQAFATAAQAGDSDAAKTRDEVDRWLASRHEPAKTR